MKKSSDNEWVDVWLWMQQVSTKELFTWGFREFCILMILIGCIVFIIKAISFIGGVF